MIQCPYCSYQSASYKGMATHFRHQKHPDYNTWKASQEAPKVEGVDYVVCLECGGEFATLRGHLKRKHGITADEYRSKHSGAQLHSSKNVELHASTIRESVGDRDTSGTKSIECPTCGCTHEVSKYFVPSTHDADCSDCKSRRLLSDIVHSQDHIRAAGVEGRDYVTCLECGHVAENLTSHLMYSHGIRAYRENHPTAPINADGSGARDKSKLLGRKHSPDTIKKMRDSGGWSKGLTWQTGDARMVSRREGILQSFRNGRESWSKGLTAKDHPSLEAASASHKRWFQEHTKYWNNGLRADLTLDDLKVFAREDGRVEMGRAITGLGYSYPTIRKYVDSCGLDRAYSTKVAQGVCLQTIQKVLGDARYIEEWRTNRFRNPDTHYSFSYDGYFPDLELVVEYHGYQHFEYPNIFHKTEDIFRKQVLRDALKRRLVLESGAYHYLEIRFDDPYDDETWVRNQLSHIL